MKTLFRELNFGIMAICLSVTFVACSTTQSSSLPMHMKHPVQIAESVERLELYARPDGMSLSARDKEAISGFLAAYAQHGSGPLYMNSPAIANRGVEQTRQLVASMLGNVGMDSIQEGQYQNRRNGPAPVIISYRRLKTLPQDCQMMSHLNTSYTNQTHPNFGCSASANLAAMIGDPKQLVVPYDMPPPDMRRRTTVYDKYITGDNPASEQPERQENSPSEG